MTFCKSNTVPGPRPAGQAPSQRSLSHTVNLSLLVGALACSNLLVSCGNQSETAPAPQPAVTNAPAAAGLLRPELAKLLGKWERADGDYVLEIKGIDASGKMEVGYFNPNPINVSRAAALRESGTNKVFIELRDANYPGCTYTLAYEPSSDQLFGQYFQASMQQTFDVVFARRQ